MLDNQCFLDWKEGIKNHNKKINCLKFVEIKSKVCFKDQFSKKQKEVKKDECI